MAAVFGNYYIDACTFEEAKAVYTDVDLTNLAPDGFYLSSGIYREQKYGFLLNVINCSICECVEP